MSRVPLKKMTKRSVRKDGTTYECRLSRDNRTRNAITFWRCGACKRGRMQSWDSECAVCHAEVVPA